MAFDAFIKIDGIDGESVAKGFEKQMEILSFSWGASNPHSVGSGSTGGGSGKVSLSSFSIMKKTEAASAKLFKACCEGKHFDSAVVTLRKAGGTAGQVPFLTYKFTGVFIDSLQWSGSSGGDDTPIESLSFAFHKVEIEYRQQDAKSGATKVAGQAYWDVAAVSGG